MILLLSPINFRALLVRIPSYSFFNRVLTILLWCIDGSVFLPMFPTLQVTAHDTDVYDIAFSSSDPKNFASVGGDGSMRLFDLG